MCIIVDANRLGTFLGDPPDEGSAPIHRWLNLGAGTLIYSTGGQFDCELGNKHRKKLEAYFRAGRARHVPAGRFAADEAALRASEDVQSDDPHVLALARESGARLLFTGDGDLMQDFKNPKLVNQPRGKIYSGAANANLLTSSACKG